MAKTKTKTPATPDAAPAAAPRADRRPMPEPPDPANHGSPESFSAAVALWKEEVAQWEAEQNALLDQAEEAAARAAAAMSDALGPVAEFPVTLYRKCKVDGKHPNGYEARQFDAEAFERADRKVWKDAPPAEE